jgi:DNA-directed RNA polymerase II subunit RPB2
MLYTGFNQQDSLIVNADTIERGFFNGTFFDNISSILDKNETFELSSKIYGKEITDNIVGGVPKNGTILHRNSVLIAKTYREGNSKLIDRSILYKNRTDGIVVNSIRGRDEKKADVLRLKFRQFKNLIVGDKLSSRTGNKGIVARLMRGTDMPYAEDGTIPDIIVNAQSIPTRRALNQLIESLFGCYAARVGTRIDATSFLPVDIEYIQNRLKDLGYDSPGYKQMYNGMTGEWINTPIFIGPTTYLRLQKFADNESHASQKGPTQATTHQPVHGRNEGGSFKISEMEVWCMATHGTARAMGTKLFTDSDGTTMYICAKCGTRAICNKETNLYRCKKCEELATIVQVPTCWTSNMYQHYIRALGIETKFDIEPLQFKTKY